MKSLYVVGLLGLGLITLSACTIGGKSNDETRNNIITPASENITVSENIPALSDGSYIADANSSVIRWRGERVIGNDHEGTVSLGSGNFEVMAGELSGGEFVIDMSSLKSDEEIDKLDIHLKSDDFFQVETYPEAKMIITSVTKENEAGLFTVNANLTIKDITAPISFLAQLSELDNQIKVQADITIDRTIWNIKYGSGKFFQDLGDSVIKDEMQLMVDITGTR